MMVKTVKKKNRAAHRPGGDHLAVVGVARIGGVMTKTEQASGRERRPRKKSMVCGVGCPLGLE